MNFKTFPARSFIEQNSIVLLTSVSLSVRSSKLLLEYDAACIPTACVNVRQTPRRTSQDFLLVRKQTNVSTVPSKSKARFYQGK